MALIRCEECGKEVSDKATSCPNCGSPIHQEKEQEKQKQPEFKKFNKNSTTGLVALILSILGFSFIVGFILAVIDIRKKDGYKKTFSKASIVICCVWILFFVFSPSETENNTPTATIAETTSEKTSQQIENEKKADEIIENIENFINQEAETTQPETETQISKEDFINSCQEFSYKTLARSPEEYVGEKIVITVKIEQVMQGGLFDSNQYYRVLTNDEYDLWLGDEYFMYDSRVEDNMKLLEDDIIKVYGNFLGTETITRALTNVKEDIPCFEALYIELISE